MDIPGCLKINLMIFLSMSESLSDNTMSGDKLLVNESLPDTMMSGDIFDEREFIWYHDAGP